MIIRMVGEEHVINPLSALFTSPPSGRARGSVRCSRKSTRLLFILPEKSQMGSTPLALKCPLCAKGEDYRRHRESREGLAKLADTDRYVRRNGRRVHIVRVLHSCGYTFETTHPQFTTNSRRQGR